MRIALPFKMILLKKIGFSDVIKDFAVQKSEKGRFVKLKLIDN